MAAIAAVFDAAGAEPESDPTLRPRDDRRDERPARIRGPPDPRARRWSRPKGSQTSSSLARQARPSLYRLCEAGPRPLVPPQLRFGAPERMGPDGPLRELDVEATETLLERLAASRTRSSGGRAAALLRPSRARARARRADLVDACPECTCRSRTSLSALSGSTSVHARPRSMRRSPPCSPPICASSASCAAEQRLPEVQVMQSSGGLTDARRAAAHAALTVLSGPAGGVGGALLLSQAGGRAATCCASTWAAPRATCA